MSEKTPHIVIVGGGFGGLAAAKALKKAPARVTLIDRTNHQLFQPLLYQVATSVLSPGQIGSPLRGIFGNQKNVTVILAEVTGVDKQERHVMADTADRTGVHISYDCLVLATGVTHCYFGHNDFAPFAPCLKRLADAVAIRNKVLQHSRRLRPRKTQAVLRAAYVCARRRGTDRRRNGRRYCYVNPRHAEIRVPPGES
jgi:NADH dehydrogenase FAD-containing subunit